MSDVTNRAEPLAASQAAEPSLAEYAGALRRFFGRRLQPHERAEADDLVQDVFVHLAGRRPADAAGRIEKPDAYLFKTATNILRDRLRRRAVRHSDAHHAYEEDLHGAHEVLTPERVLLGREAVDRVERALSGLPERTRTIFMLNRFEEMRYADIAASLGISVSLIEKEVMRAIAHLTQALGARR